MPQVRVFAWGGTRMAAAGAEVIERTGGDAVMGVPGLEKIREHKRMNARIDKWIETNKPDLHVPVDSPGANFSICRIAKRHGVRVVHFVAPQIWAWGPWRIHKLRRLTDLVLCLLPFEEGYFTTRGVPARFVGHPLFDEALDVEVLERDAAAFGTGRPRLALMPGSRPGELTKNFPPMLEAFRQLQTDQPGLVGVVAAMDERVERRLRDQADENGGWPDGLGCASGKTDAVIHWCDLALVVSGTVTLQIAKQRKAMVVFYTSGRLFYHAVARWLLSTRYFALPNLIAGKEIVPELIPHFGPGGPIADVAAHLLASDALMQEQRDELGRVVERFAATHAANAGAESIGDMLGISTGKD
jgi:lipid-A-disaccharide synthase